MNLHFLKKATFRIRMYNIISMYIMISTYDRDLEFLPLPVNDRTSTSLYSIGSSRRDLQLSITFPSSVDKSFQKPR